MILHALPAHGASFSKIMTSPSWGGVADCGLQDCLHSVCFVKLLEEAVIHGFHGANDHPKCLGLYMQSLFKRLIHNNFHDE